MSKKTRDSPNCAIEILEIPPALMMNVEKVVFARLAATQAGARRVLAKADVRNLRLERIKKVPHLTKQRFFQNSAF